jgi:hypothetical protein
MVKGEYRGYVEEENDLTCTVWSDTNFASNCHSARGNDTVTRKSRNGDRHQRPAPPCVKVYNANMGAIDEHDHFLVVCH